MTIVQNAKIRYSTKAFNPQKKLSEEQIQELKDLVRMSPSSVNSQPWHFILAGTQEGKERIAKSTQGGFEFNASKILDASHVMVFTAKTSIDDQYLLALLESEEQAGRFANKGSKQGQHNGRSTFVNLHRFDLKDINHWMEKQLYLNVGTLLLGASAMGIDAVPMEGFDPKILDEEFGLRGQGFTSSVIVPLGYRSDDDFNAGLPKSRWSESQLFTQC
ncbi:MAG: oxygen-insensitive NAD(P)H nitroreductase [Ostreibacterium sp.]